MVVERNTTRVFINTVDHKLHELVMVTNSSGRNDYFFRDHMVHHEVLKELGVNILHIALEANSGHSKSVVAICSGE